MSFGASEAGARGLPEAPPPHPENDSTATPRRRRARGSCPYLNRVRKRATVVRSSRYAAPNCLLTPGTGVSARVWRLPVLICLPGRDARTATRYRSSDDPVFWGPGRQTQVARAGRRGRCPTRLPWGYSLAAAGALRRPKRPPARGPDADSARDTAIVRGVGGRAGRSVASIGAACNAAVKPRRRA